METLIEHIIADFHERKLPFVTPRNTKLAQITGKIDTVIGMRRTGKTYLLYQTMHEKIQQGIPKQRLLYINFDDERLQPLNASNLHLIIDTYYRLFPEFKQKKCYFFFDEIQNVSGWEKFIRRLLDTENIHLYLTGSSAKLLSKEIASTLRGRSLTTEIFPFSFYETLIHENPKFNAHPNPGAQTRAFLSNRIRQFLLRGGFPETLTINEHYRIGILQEYVDVVILRDVVERYSIKNIQALRAMTRQLLANPATLFSINKFYNDLKSQGISCTKNTLYDYLEYLYDAFLVFPTSIFNRSQRIRRTNPRKIYLIDTGLINAFSHEPQSNLGHLLENFVYLELLRRGLNIEYYHTKEKLEVDFITTSIKGTQELYQVALNLLDAKTREREIRALTLAMKERKLKHASIITLDHQETIKSNAGIINVLPAWHWALELGKLH